MRDRWNLSLTASPNLRTTALIDLIKGRKSLDELRNDLNVSSTTAAHTLRELEKCKLVYEDAERHYYLTNIGRIIAHELIVFDDTAETLDTFESFWLEHDLSGIPDHLLERIGWLKDSRIISGTPINVFKAYSTVIKLLKDAKTVKVVSSVLIPDIELILDLYSGQREMRAILTEAALQFHIEDVGREQARKALEKKLKLFLVRQTPKIGFFTVTEHFMALVPYRLDGTFDWSSDLISCNKTAIDWGLELFNHYAEVAERVDLS